MTTEHFTLQGARTAAITESTSRATIFIGSVSAGLVALGLIATATRIGTAFYAFGLILLWTLSFLGFVTFDRALQSAIEELHYAERIARLRAYYFDFAPELTAVWAPIIHPCWSDSMSVLVESAAESVSSADIEVRDPLRIGDRFG